MPGTVLIGKPVKNRSSPRYCKSLPEKDCALCHCENGKARMSWDKPGDLPRHCILFASRREKRSKTGKIFLAGLLCIPPQAQ